MTHTKKNNETDNETDKRTSNRPKTRKKCKNDADRKMVKSLDSIPRKTDNGDMCLRVML